MPSEEFSVEKSIKSPESLIRTENDLCSTIHGEPTKGRRKGKKDATPANTRRGPGTGTTTDGKSHHGKLGHLGEPGYTIVHNNNTTRYRGKTGRAEIEALGRVSKRKSMENTSVGKLLTSLDKASK